MEILVDIASKIGFDWKLSITHLINLLIIFFLLVKFALPSIKKVVVDRTKKIEEGLKMRDDANKIVDDANSNAKEINLEANKKAENIISKSEANAKVLKTEAIEKASEIIKSANQIQADAKEKGMNDAEGILNKNISSIISKISNQAFGDKLNSDNNSEFVSNVFKQNYGK